MDFSTTIQCPHCGYMAYEAIEIDFDSADLQGTPYTIEAIRCFDCDKKYWVEASLRFDLDIADVYDKKPERKLACYVANGIQKRIERK